MKRGKSGLCVAIMGLATCGAAATNAVVAAHWEACGWGGGGLYWSVAFHPAKPGTLYLGGDVNGLWKSTDYGRHWSFINNGILQYAIYGLAVDRQSPETVYAVSEGGLHKSTDGGAHWQFVEGTGRKDLRITAERHTSVRPVAVDPSDSRIVYAASPGGCVYKSTDGAQTWTNVYTVPVPTGSEPAPPGGTLRVQFGGVNGAIFGGVWTPLVIPAGTDPARCQGFGFRFMGNGTAPKDAFLDVRTADGAQYQSRNLAALFTGREPQDVWLAAADFALKAGAAKTQPEKAKAWRPQPAFDKLVRADFSCVNMVEGKPSVAFLGALYVAAGREAPAAERVVVCDVGAKSTLANYGNAQAGEAKPVDMAAHSVAVSAKEPKVVMAATRAGLAISRDAGRTWQALAVPAQDAMSVVVADSDPNVMYSAFATGGLWKSLDQGQTWKDCSPTNLGKIQMREVAVSPVDPNAVYAIGNDGWSGRVYLSTDGGTTWAVRDRMTSDPAHPDLQAGKTPALSKSTNLAIDPNDPKRVFISANWRSCVSDDGGQTWTESTRGADITCFYGGIRFSGNRVYACAGDEGAFVSEDDGASWRNLWPARYDTTGMSGHYWAQVITRRDGKDRLIQAMSPWTITAPNMVVISEDGGATCKTTRQGLPDYRPTANTMWGISHPRGLAVDPTDPKVVYLGMDGDATDGKMGGGIFKSLDGGYTWRQLAKQPGSRRGYYGLAIDPTDSKRLYWTACGDRGGVYLSEDAGESWTLVYRGSQWIFNLVVAFDGTVYAGDKELIRSTDHGKTWKAVSSFGGRATVLGMDVHPSDSKTLWISRAVWGGFTNYGEVGIFKTTDGGATWQDLTGDLPVRFMTCVRFNPQTSELWAAGAGVFKLRP